MRMNERLTYIHEFGEEIFDSIDIFSHVDDVLLDCLSTLNTSAVDLSGDV